MASTLPDTAAAPPASDASVSARRRVARVALEAALDVDGVVAGCDGPLGLRATRDGAERLGVVSTADAAGGYSVSLHLIVRLVPLEPLAGRIRAGVEAALAAVALNGELAQLDIVFEDIASDQGTD